MRWLPFFILLSSSMVEAADSVVYTVRFPSPISHYAEVEASIPSAPLKTLEVFLPVWTPGSYLVREYSRNIEDMTAQDISGRTLEIHKTRKNRWLVASGKQ